jgi:hypothetical protein
MEIEASPSTKTAQDKYKYLITVDGGGKVVVEALMSIRIFTCF